MKNVVRKEPSEKKLSPLNAYQVNGFFRGYVTWLILDCLSSDELIQVTRLNKHYYGAVLFFLFSFSRVWKSVARPLSQFIACHLQSATGVSLLKQALNVSGYRPGWLVEYLELKLKNRVIRIRDELDSVVMLQALDPNNADKWASRRSGALAKLEGYIRSQTEGNDGYMLREVYKWLPRRMKHLSIEEQNNLLNILTSSSKLMRLVGNRTYMDLYYGSQEEEDSFFALFSPVLSEPQRSLVANYIFTVTMSQGYKLDDGYFSIHSKHVAVCAAFGRLYSASAANPIPDNAVNFLLGMFKDKDPMVRKLVCKVVGGLVGLSEGQRSKLISKLFEIIRRGHNRKYYEGVPGYQKNSRRWARLPDDSEPLYLDVTSKRDMAFASIAKLARGLTDKKFDSLWSWFSIMNSPAISVIKAMGVLAPVLTNEQRNSAITGIVGLGWMERDRRGDIVKALKKIASTLTAVSSNTVEGCLSRLYGVRGDLWADLFAGEYRSNVLPVFCEIAPLLQDAQRVQVIHAIVGNLNVRGQVLLAEWQALAAVVRGCKAVPGCLIEAGFILLREDAFMSSPLWSPLLHRVGKPFKRRDGGRLLLIEAVTTILTHPGYVLLRKGGELLVSALIKFLRDGGAHDHSLACKKVSAALSRLAPKLSDAVKRRVVREAAPLLKKNKNFSDIIPVASEIGPPLKNKVY